MTKFRDLSIHKKLVIVNSASCLLVSLIVSGFFIFSEVSSVRTSVLDDLFSLANVIGINVQAPLEFMDPGTATEVLSSLSALPRIQQARIYTSDQQLFAQYQNPSLTNELKEDLTADILTARILLGQTSCHVGRFDIDVAVPVGNLDAPVGTIVLQSDTSALQAIYFRLLLVIGGILIATLLLSFLLSKILDRYISRPVLALADTMSAICREDNYSLRAARNSEDEIGVLVTGVNSMLDNLELRDAQLLEAKQEAEDANRAKSRFLAQMSHEIRTPMNGVLGLAALLLKTELDKEQKTFVQTIYRSGEALLQLINDILDFSKIEAGKLVLEKVHFNLRGLAEETVELFSNTASEKNVNLSCFVQPALPEYVVGDPGRLRQILMNLLGNALKFTRNGDVALTIFPEETDTTGVAHLRFEVSDSGIGISREKQQKIFAAFSQADGSTTRKFGGTGLGLAICRQLVQLMGGTIGVTSEEGQGSVFRFTIRLAVGRAEAAVSSTENAASAEKLQGFSGTVLVVEDNVTNRIVARGMLENIGLKVDMAENGEQAVAASEKISYDLIFMDCQMPVMDGYQATGIIRQRENEHGAARTPIIALTAHAMKGDREQCLAVGMDDYLAKPFTEQQLCAVLEKWLPQQCTDTRKNETKEIVTDNSPVSAVDPSVLESYRAYQQEGEPDIVARLVDIFLKNSPEVLEEMSKACKEREVEQLWKLAHSFKSSSATVGAVRLASLCEDMEMRGRNNQLEGLVQLLEKIVEEFDRARNVLQSYGNGV